MTHKQFKFGKGKRSRKVKPEVKPVEEEYESAGAYRRALLPSPSHADRLADESTRARLINSFVNSSEDHYDTREFASYYRAPTRYIEPPYSITSHTNAVYIPKAPQVIPTYPSLIPAPQWCPPYDRQVLEHSQQDLMNRKYNCRCLKCTSPDCPARDVSQLRARRVKDNIMTFSDQSTMTRNLNDAGCGSTPTPSTLNCPAMPIPGNTSMVRFRDPQGKVKFYAVNHNHDTYTPAPILKNGYNADAVNTNRWRQSQDEYDECEQSQPMSLKCCFKEDETRKNIYNEGISDVALEFPSYSSGVKLRPRPPRSATRLASRATALSERCSDSEMNIPYSHKGESRYHKHCVDAPMPMFVQDDFRATSKQRIPASSPIIPPRSRTPPRLKTPPRPMTPPQPRAPCCSGTQQKPKQRIIKLPKKLLTSEKVLAPQKCKLSWGKR